MDFGNFPSHPQKVFVGQDHLAWDQEVIGGAASQLGTGIYLKTSLYETDHLKLVYYPLREGIYLNTSYYYRLSGLGFRIKFL